MATTATGSAMAPSASRIRSPVASGRPPYFRVAVPVMFEWIVHTYVYEPADSAGTS